MTILQTTKIDNAQESAGEPVSMFRRSLLFVMFIILMMDIIPGLGIGVGLGLSAKNLFLYLIVIMIGVRAAFSSSGISFVHFDIHAPFLSLIAYSVVTWAIASMFDPTYSTFRGAMTMKNQLVDYYLFMFAFWYGINSREDYLWLLRAIVVTMFLASFITLIDHANIPDLGIVGTHKGRVAGLIGGVNQYAGMLAFLLPISVAVMPQDLRFASKWFWRIGIVVTGILLLATGSRGAYVATAAGSVFCLFYLRRNLNTGLAVKYAAVSILILSLAVIGFFAFNPDFILERIQKSTAGNLSRSSSGRLEIWTAGILVMKEWPFSFLVGYGWNSYEYSGIWKSAHNEYLDRFFELGLIGLGIFIMLLRSVASRASNAISNVDPEVGRVLIGFVFAITIIAIDIFFSAIPDTWTLIWLVTGLVMGLQVCTSVPDQTGVRGPEEKDGQDNSLSSGTRHLSSDTYMRKRQ